MISRIVFLALLSFSFFTFGQDSDDGDAAPELYGPNAFSFSHPVLDAAVEELHEIDISTWAQRNSPGEKTEKLALRVKFNFGTKSSLYIDTHLEHWNVSEELRDIRMGEDTSGTNLGDINLTGKFNFLEENPTRPAISFKMGLKTASGRDENKRYTDSAGYELTALVAKNLAQMHCRFLSEIGFVAWDDGEFSQNDAIKFSLSLERKIFNHLHTRGGVYGILGWKNNGDRPLTAYVEAYKLIRRPKLEVYGMFHSGINSDANEYSIGVGARKKFAPGTWKTKIGSMWENFND